jgi:PAS domain S-box-containing protein
LVKDIEQEAYESTRTDEALGEPESRDRRLFKAARDGILILDADTGQIADANQFLLEMPGYAHKEFLDKKLWEVAPFRDIEEKRSFYK